MARGNGESPSVAVAVPDMHGWIGSWDVLSTQMSAQSTALSRDALVMALHLFEQSAAHASQWLRALGQGAQRIGDLAQAAERRIGSTEDVAGVWNLELDLLGESAQVAATFGQEAWLVFARTQTELMQSVLAQGEQRIERVAPLVRWR